MPFSFAAYTQTVTARLVADGFYRYPTEDSAIKAFASLNTDGTDVMVGDMILPGITMCANSSFTGNMKTVNGRFTEEVFAYAKVKFALPVLSQLNTVEGVGRYLANVVKPLPVEKKLKDSPELIGEYLDEFLDEFVVFHASALLKAITEELAKRPDAEVEKIVGKFVMPLSPPGGLASFIELLQALEQRFTAMNPKLAKAIGQKIPWAAYAPIWESGPARKWLVALFRGHLMVQQEGCSRLFMCLLLEAHQRLSEVNPFDHTWAYKLEPKKELKEVHGFIGWMMHDADARASAAASILAGGKKLQEESYNALALIVREKIGVAPMPAAERKELEAIREAAKKFGFAAEFLDFEVPEDLAEAVRLLEPKVVEETIAAIHAALPEYPQEEIEKKHVKAAGLKVKYDEEKKRKAEAQPAR